MKYKFLVIVFSVLQALNAQTIQVNSHRLQSSWESLRNFGYDPTTQENLRVAFSDHNIEALHFLKSKLEYLGLKVHIDAAGNLIANKEGLYKELKPIAFGSHIDCVPKGGLYDGQLGVLGAIEIIETLVENKLQTDHPLQLIIFSNEEGGVFGSRALAGSLTEESLNVHTKSGYTNREGINRLGGDASKVFQIKRTPASLHAFLELHIEQGGQLEENNLQIGVVQGIVGLRWWDVTLTGVSNHGGTTPMNKRQDALLAASRFTLMVNRVVRSHPGTQVGTVGRIQAFPGAPNVIPGKVELSLELRDLNEDKLDQLFSEIKEEAELIGAEEGVAFEFKSISATSKAALTDIRIQNTIEKNAQKLGYTSMRMPSGAGHDSQEMTHISPTGMIFIPSQGGISHSPKEFSNLEDMTRGTQLLLETILSLDRKKEID